MVANQRRVMDGVQRSVMQHTTHVIIKEVRKRVQPMHRSSVAESGHQNHSESAKRKGSDTALVQEESFLLDLARIIGMMPSKIARMGVYEPADMRFVAMESLKLNMVQQAKLKAWGKANEVKVGSRVVETSDESEDIEASRKKRKASHSGDKRIQHRGAYKSVEHAFLVAWSLVIASLGFGVVARVPNPGLRHVRNQRSTLDDKANGWVDVRRKRRTKDFQSFFSRPDVPPEPSGRRASKSWLNSKLCWLNQALWVTLSVPQVVVCSRPYEVDGYRLDPPVRTPLLLVKESKLMSLFSTWGGWLRIHCFVGGGSQGVCR
eukprot:6107315-Amphidinium_carterae.1